MKASATCLSRGLVTGDTSCMFYTYCSTFAYSKGLDNSRMKLRNYLLIHLLSRTVSCLSCVSAKRLDLRDDLHRILSQFHTDVCTNRWVDRLRWRGSGTARYVIVALVQRAAGFISVFTFYVVPCPPADEVFWSRLQLDYHVRCNPTRFFRLHMLYSRWPYYIRYRSSAPLLGPVIPHTGIPTAVYT